MTKHVNWQLMENQRKAFYGGADKAAEYMGALLDRKWGVIRELTGERARLPYNYWKADDREKYRKWGRTF